MFLFWGQERRKIRNRMSAQQHRERQRQRVDTLEDCLRQRDQEIAKLKGEVRAPSKVLGVGIVALAAVVVEVVISDVCAVVGLGVVIFVVGGGGVMFVLLDVLLLLLSLLLSSS